MASTINTPFGPNTPITIKISVQGVYKKLKLPLSDLVPAILPGKLREFLDIPESQAVVFERFSDSSASYVNLDPSNVHAYKTLYRAAKAKLKLRMRALLGPNPLAYVAQQTEDTARALDDTLRSIANLKLASTSTLTNIPGPSAPVMPIAPKINPIQIVEVDAKPKSNVLFQQQPAEPSVFASNEKMMDLHKVVAEMFSALKEEPSPVTSSPTKPSTEQKMNARREFGSSVTAPRTFVHRTLGETQQANSWSVYCDHCEKNMLNEHFHCNICNAGDFDICVECKDAGVHCFGENHWLIKRVFNPNGSIVTSTTEKVEAKPKSEDVKEMPGTFTEEKKPEEPVHPTRTCNCCVKVFQEPAFVTCNDCEDYDLCIPCLEQGKHGHHPAHNFEPATDLTNLSEKAKKLCKPGRNAFHSATCDNCDSTIFGVRYKCQICPDWDYCSDCIDAAPVAHAGHRFAPIYDAIPMHTIESFQAPVHHGIYCDGPLCTNTRSYIRGIRYKCAVCSDVDFCANCEASPMSSHNSTHPFLKFRSPVRHCSITTEVRDRTVSYHGDGNKSQFDATVAAAVVASAAAKAAPSPIQTIVDVKPAETLPIPKERIEIKDLLSDPIPNNEVVDQCQAIKETLTDGTFDDLQAYFVGDTIADGTSFAPGQRFIQGWTLKNPGQQDWPVGCSVRYVGGDSMLDIDDSAPSAEADVSKASETNVVHYPVKAGESFSFRIQMRAPKRTGCAISYWRLKAPDGTPFGHRLWCHINVVPGPHPGPVVYPRKCPHAPFNSSAERSVITADARRAERDQIMRQIRAYRRREIRLGPPSPSAANVKNPLTEASFIDRVRALDGLLADRLQRLKTSNDNQAVTAKDDSDIKAVEPPVETEIELESSSNLVFPAADSQDSIKVEGVATNAAESVNIPAVAEPQTVIKNEDDLFHDAESISLDSSDESGFFTDEEYDILNASDEEGSKA